MRKTYRQWVEEGAHGFFMTAGLVTEGVVIVATEIAFPDSPLAALLQGYFVRRQSYDPATDGAHTGGGGDGDVSIASDASDARRRGQPLREEWLADPEEAVIFGWVTWETVGEAVDGAHRSTRDHHEPTA